MFFSTSTLSPGQPRDTAPARIEMTDLVPPRAARENSSGRFPIGGCMSNDDKTSQPMSRRAVLKSATAAAATVAASSIHASAADAPVATKGRIKQSLVHWCYSKYWEPPQLA